MRPIRLCMAAFGPFAGEEHIDFTKLGDNPLFLINGPTGAGKSTILDAICFALYGETTGNEREARQMRCDHANPATLTEVTLEFELATGRYKITRIPDQERPKSRGEGVTVQKARAELYKLEGEEKHLIVSPKVTEATQEIINLTGLSAEQFRQVMVLPQGKFRDLLLAKSDERETIFQQLFQTQVYSTLQTKLREQANVLIIQIKETQLHQKTLLEAHELDSREQLLTELDTLKKQLKALENQKQQSTEKLKHLQTELQQALLLENIFLEREQAQKIFHELEAKQTDIEQQKIRLEKAKIAQKIETFFRETKKQKSVLDETDRQVKDSQQALDNAAKTLQALANEKQNLPDKENYLQKLKNEIIELGNYRQRSQQLQIAQTNLIKTEKELFVSNELLTNKQSQLQTAKKSLEQAEKTLLAQTMYSADLAEKKSKLENLIEQGRSLRKIAEFQTNLEVLNKTILSLKQSKEQAEKTYQQKAQDKEIFEQAWQKGQAAILAATLHDDEPCPVCGSTQHPVIARTKENLPTEQELNKVSHDTEEARNRLEKITREILLKEEEIKNLLNNLNEEKAKELCDAELSLQTINQDAQICRNEIASLQEVIKTLPQLQQQIENNKNDIKYLEDAFNQARQLETEQQSAFASAKTDVQNKEAELPERYRQKNALENAVNKAAGEHDKLKKSIDDFNQRYQQARESYVSAETALKSSQASQQTTRAHYNDTIDIWQGVLEQSAFVSEQVFLQAILGKDVEEQLTNSIRQYEDEKLLAQKQLEEKNAATVNKTRPDINQLKKMESQAITAKNNIDNDYHKTHQRKQLLSITKDKLEKWNEKQTTLEKEFGIVGKLSDISNGKNPYKLSLQRFVLSVLLDDVLTEASYRLYKMSKGRYQLYRKETVGDKRSKAGLELEVEDAYTGKQRPAATLSGGESFLAALALALGLSDVVQAYAGGIRLDTLFIDEGFGSLDPESLDLAMNTLLDLRASGRMIGVISHVEEMRRIIDVRMDVLPDRGKSSIKLVVA